MKTLFSKQNRWYAYCLVVVLLGVVAFLSIGSYALAASQFVTFAAIFFWSQSIIQLDAMRGEVERHLQEVASLREKTTRLQQNNSGLLYVMNDIIRVKMQVEKEASSSVDSTFEFTQPTRLSDQYAELARKSVPIPFDSEHFAYYFWNKNNQLIGCFSAEAGQPLDYAIELAKFHGIEKDYLFHSRRNHVHGYPNITREDLQHLSKTGSVGNLWFDLNMESLDTSTWNHEEFVLKRQSFREG